MAVGALWASEHHGQVTSAGFPLPGATVTATQGTRKLVTTTDDNGVYSFTDLPDGVWTIQVEMLGFGTFSREVGIAPEAPAPHWDLKLLSAEQIKAALAPPPASPGAPSATPAAPKTETAATPSTAPAAPSSPTSGKAPTTTQTASASNTPQRGGRNGQNGANGRPSLRQAVSQGAFQRANVNASGNAENASEGAENTAALNADVGGGDIGSGDALVVGGSVSAGLGMQQTDDWAMGRGGPGGFGPGGFGPGGFGPGGLGQGPGGDNNGLGGDQVAGRGRGGPGGPGGGGPGGGAGFGGPGGRGGGGFGGGGFGGPGGGGGGGGRAGRGGGGANPRGRGGQNGRGNVNAFGNGRRNVRQRYNANLNFSLNNSALDARQYSLTGQNTPKPAFAQSNMSAILGGPLKIPHLLSGQKTTFTLNYQLRRNRNSNNITTTVPTLAERGGDFSQALSLNGKPVTILDPLNGGAPFPNNAIPTQRLSSQALGLLSFYPLPNFTSSTSNYNYQVPITSITNNDNINTRISHTFNAKNQVSGNFAFQRSDGTTPNLFGFITNSHQNAYNSGVNYTYHITTRLIERFGVTVSRNAQNTTPYFANRQDVTSQLGITYPFGSLDPNYWGPPSLSFSNGFYGLSDGSTTRNHSQTSAVTENMMWIHGKHTMQFGGDFRRQQFNYFSESNPRGSLNFTGGITGFDLADFMLGLPYTSSIANGNPDKYFRANWFDGYVTDDFRLSTRLSLNMGLRWDYQLPTTEKYGRLVNIAIGQNFATAQAVCATAIAGCATADQSGFPNSLFNTNAHAFQPRIGYAWRPFAKASTLVRGGFGLYYNTSVYQSLAPQMAQQAPFSYSWIDTTTVTPLTLANPFPRPSLNPLPTFGVDPNLRLGYAEVWQLSVQQSLPGALVATVTYNGTKGTHQMQQIIPNSVAPGATASPYPSNYTYLMSNGNSIMNSVSTQLQRRFRSGFSGNLAYIFARGLDNSGSLGGRGGALSAAQNWQDLDAERARTSGIRTHTFNNQLQYSTGQGARGGSLISGWKGVLLKDWNLTTMLSVASGAPETPSVASRALGGTGIIGPLRADYVGGPIYNSDGTLNVNAFIVPPSGTYGNAGRNIITGPMLFTLNAGASRIIRLGERRSLDFQVQSTNVLNHVTFNSYNTTVGSIQYGLLQSPAQMRNIVANLRFRF